MALRGWQPPFRWIAARSVGNASRQPRASRRAEGDREADAAVGSKIFNGTKRDWWMYVPAQYRAEHPAAVMLFQDGNGPRTWAPTVFDNLIAKKDMLVTVGVFIEPGGTKTSRDNRSFEYDTLSDQYTRFLLEKFFPRWKKTVKLRHDAASRAIARSGSRLSPNSSRCPFCSPV